MAAQETARNIIEDLDPSWIAVVGICGAVPDSEFTLGDVIVASRLHAFTLGVIKEDERPQFTNLGAPLSRRAEDLVGYIKALEPDLSGWEADQQIGLTRPEVILSPNNFYGSDERKRQTEKILAGHFGGPRRRTQPIVTTRPVASSDFLIKDTATLEDWQSSARDASSIEMELAGIFEAARRPGREYPILAVRGISDIIGFKRSGDWTQYACECAASLFFALVRVMPEHFLRENPHQITSPPFPIRRPDESETTPDLASRATPALPRQRVTIREKSAAEILANLQGIGLSHQFREKVEDLYLGRWTRGPGWQTTVHDLPSKLPGGHWYCTFKEAGSGTLVFAVTAQDVSTLRPGDSVTVSGRIREVSQLQYVSLEDAILRGDIASFL